MNSALLILLGLVALSRYQGVAAVSPPPGNYSSPSPSPSPKSPSPYSPTPSPSPPSPSPSSPVYSPPSPAKPSPSSPSPYSPSPMMPSPSYPSPPSPYTPSKKKILFEVKLTGAADKVITKATGTVKAVIDEVAQIITGTLEVKNIKDVTQAHFHIGGPKVANGPIGAWIWLTATRAITTQPFTTTKWSVPFNVTAGDVIASTTSTPPIAGFKDFVKALKKGLIYANVHTLKNPAGEIRGQTHVVKPVHKPKHKVTHKP